jgi:cytochrome c
MLSAVAVFAESPGLGVPLKQVELASLQPSILSDGTGLPPGSGSVQAGADVYARNCMACHGSDGTGTVNDALVGGIGSLTGPRPVLTVGSFWPWAPPLFDYVRRAMPYQTPGSLSDADVYSVTAYVLFLNGIIEADAVLDAQRLTDVRMPNADGFYLAYP